MAIFINKFCRFSSYVPTHLSICYTVRIRLYDRPGAEEESSPRRQIYSDSRRDEKNRWFVSK